MAWTSFPNEVYAYILSTEGFKNKAYRLGKEPYYSIGVGHLCNPGSKRESLGNIIPGVSGNDFNSHCNNAGATLTDEQVFKLLKSDVEANMSIWKDVQGNYSVQVQAVMASLAHFGPGYAKKCVPFLNRNDLNGMKDTFLGCYGCADKQFEAHHKQARQIQWETMTTGVWKDAHGHMTDEKFLAHLNELLQKVGGGLASNGPGVGSGSGTQVMDGSFNMGHSGVSKFWYLGAAHNIMNNAQMEKLYVDVKLRGCNLSILRGEKVPMLVIDNKHKTNLAEPDAAHIDPTTMMDTWASGWFMIGGISYIYDPLNSGNANKWTTQMKLQRMEWPTPTEIMDPSSKNARMLRYNLAEGMDGFNVDAGVTVEGTSANDIWHSKDIILGTAGLDPFMKQLIQLFDQNKIPYQLVSARRYPLDEFGNIVKEKKAATVKFAGSYAFKCADGVRFFRNPISDHSWGQGIDIIQAEGSNFNKLLSDIIDCDDILIHMYNNGLALYEEEATDDLGKANSHFHIGTNINLPSVGGSNDANKIGDNWWNGVIAVKGNTILRGYSLKMWKKNIKKTVTLAPMQEWTLKKFFNSDKDWESQSFGNHELSYDDWIAKVKNTLEAEVAASNPNSAKAKEKFEEILQDHPGTVVSSESTLGIVPQTDEPNAYIPSIPRGASPTTVNAMTNEANAYNNYKVSSSELISEDNWDRLSGNCLEDYHRVEQLFNDYIKTDKMTVADEHFQDAIAHLSQSMGKIKVIMDNVSTDELLIQKTEEAARKLQKRFNLDTIYYNSKKLLDDIEKYMMKYNADYIRGLADSSTGVEIDPETGGMKVNLLSTSNAQMIPMESIMKDVEQIQQVYNDQINKIKQTVTCRSISTAQWYNATQWHGNIEKYPTIDEFFYDFIRLSGVNPNNILICDKVLKPEGADIYVNYTSYWSKGIIHPTAGKISSNQDIVVDIYIYDEPGSSKPNDKKWVNWVDRNDLGTDKILTLSWANEFSNSTPIIPFNVFSYFGGSDRSLKDVFNTFINTELKDLLGWLETNKKIFPWWCAKYKALLDYGMFDKITQEDWYHSDIYDLWMDAKNRIIK